ncbi:hypothetical protein [Sphingomonas sp. UNC305MFCol5.2]|uniref:hypothetical protein n=1 Tax=Sphingomonas sp. UNC305MFCol5.2 TaxID=1449076 RepID=UPI0012DE36B2|nr:hypothetical protein [Sphingomonas sp. UNC305MFCol5.2]
MHPLIAYALLVAAPPLSGMPQTRPGPEDALKRTCDVAGPCLTPALFLGTRHSGLFYLSAQPGCRPPSCLLISIEQRQASGYRRAFYQPIRVTRAVFAEGTPDALRLFPDPGDVERGHVIVEGIVVFDAARAGVALSPVRAHYSKFPPSGRVP